MGMAVASGSGGKKRVAPVMNVTPLVDVVLVLLIIFMVVTPMLTKQFSLFVPPKPEESVPPPPPDAVPPIVLKLDRSGAAHVNGETVALDELSARLVRMLNARADKVVFFDADSEVPYGSAMDLLDRLRAGGVDTLAVLAEELPAD